MKLNLKLSKPKPAGPANRPVRPRKPLMLRASAARRVDEDLDDDDYAEPEPNMRMSHAFIIVLILHIVAVGGMFGFNWMKNRAAQEASRGASTAAAAKTAEPAKVEAGPNEVMAARETSSSVKAPSAAPVEEPALSETGIHLVVAGDTLTKIASMYGVSVEALEKENGLSSNSTIRVGQRLRIQPAESVAQSAAAPAASTQTIKSVETRKPEATAAVKTAAATKPEAPAAKPSPSSSAKAAAAKDVKTPGEYVVAKGDNPYSIAKKFKVSYQELLKLNEITDPTKLQIGQTLKLPKASRN